MKDEPLIEIERTANVVHVRMGHHAVLLTLDQARELLEKLTATLPGVPRIQRFTSGSSGNYIVPSDPTKFQETMLKFIREAQSKE